MDKYAAFSSDISNYIVECSMILIIQKYYFTCCKMWIQFQYVFHLIIEIGNFELGF